ncbi:amphiphysin isoform X2 [Periophthalmus magnuspinnatus]|uniref:amphiphysin isoform X2 n=1 Tax=Periophthalmus magnuspinnatus TaxID=409849 RepID=UPI002436CC6D|nr:amphiphysin isoform X2 [Periophthalmus magnuspinnatus]
MAEIKTGIFAKNVQKRINRAQEKVLQKLGKADETKDEQFEQVVINFRRQESEGSRLQREMKNYMAAIKGMQQASINLTQSLHEVYEPDWHGKDDVVLIGKDCDALWEDFHNKIVDSTLLNLDAYLTQFPDLKTRVAKRSRKLIDYDSARHHMETLQAQGLKNDRKMIKAEEELKKAQRVFEDLNVGLQDELPTLWDSRVQFYIDTFKSVTILEAKFHREISLVCRQLYEVMTKLAEQHPDKMFNIQGAPSDSGPLRLARTPSPPEDDSPPESPEANHRLRPVSPGPPRPKSPIQGPPVPPPPKVSPPKEEPIIDLFGGEFLPAPSPSQFNERPGESLLDLDLDAFQVDESVAPIPQTTVPWDMWTADSQQDQAANAFNGFSTEGGAPAFFADFDKMNQDQAPLTSSPGTEGEGPKDEGVGSIPGEEPKAEEWPIDSQELEPSEEPPSTDPSPAEVQEEPEKTEEPEPVQAEVPRTMKDAEEGGAEEGGAEEGGAEEGGAEAEAVVQKKESPVEEPEKMAIPSVVIEPASSNEGDDDRDADIISPTVVTGNTSTPGVQHIGPSDGTLPHDFLYKVETMHDFEAANSDELELSRGDVVLVVPTVNQEDQEAGWLTGIKLSDWSSLGVSAQRGLFPENFVQQLD